ELKVEDNDNFFLRNYQVGEILRMPIAHKEGRYYISSEGIEELKENNQIVLRYAFENPNGSVESIAGIINKKRNVMGMMPHPERAVEEILGSTSGLKIFLSFLD
ncbi:MAG TPA: phosphoribosylformylglycinamidine synthase subunit PurQ, partial [Dictyoglomaceae bacterium]|nr:phosphoribosylformylglycinamidine synthase subunit PurQ [Dictyoglomaceae bacterium]